MVTKMSNTTRLIDKLITKGYVERTVCPTNRRKVEIVITKEGLKILAEIDPIVTKAEENITANLKNNELEQLNNMLNNLRH
jgi:DNA-binding MarR family transcriptional regulator